jgi:hypothetical protein
MISKYPAGQSLSDGEKAYDNPALTRMRKVLTGATPMLR